MRVTARRLPAVANLKLAAGAAAIAAGLAAAQPSAALTILAHYDASVTGLSNAAAVEGAFNKVAADYAHSFANPATINVNVSWGSVAGQALPSTAVGASVDNLYGYFSYAQIKSDLSSFAAANPADTALATAAKSLPTAAPAGPSQYVVPSSEAKVLGLISPTQSSVDGSIGFAGSSLGYDYYPVDGVTTGTYDFEAVAAHELAEVLGRIGGISSASPTWRTPLDLFRYSAPGVLDYGYNDAAYFSIDGGTTSLKAFNNVGSGDRTDWASGAYDVSNAFISKGHAYNLTAADLTALDVLGYGGSNLGDTAAGYPTKTAFALVNPSAGVPEPTAWVLMVVGVGLTGATLRRRRALQPVRIRR